MADNASAELQAKGPPLKDTDGEYPGFLWHVWAATGRKRLHNVHVVDSVVIINGRIRAWIFYSHKEKRILSKKTQNITVQGIWDSFCRGRKSYDCVASFTSPYKPSHLPPYPNWIADGVAIMPNTVDKHVQYFSPKGLNAFLRMAEKHSDFDKAWELQLSKKYNDLAGSGKRSNWNVEEASQIKASVWEAAYPDQNIPHGFTGVLRLFDNPMGDTNHEIVCTLTRKMFLCERRSCKHKIATPGIAMIHKLDIHSGSARLEDMSGTPVATTLETTTRTILQHVSSVASNVRIDKCSIVFRMPASPSRSIQWQPRRFARLDGHALRPRITGYVDAYHLTHTTVQSLARLVSVLHRGGQPVFERQELEQPLNISDDGRTFTCAVTGMELPIEQGHKVTIKQLLDHQDQCQEQYSNTGQNEVPLVIQRAMPGLRAAEFSKLRMQTHFLLSWAFVREAEAVSLLRNSLQVFNGPAEMEKVRKRFALKREMQDLAALGVPLGRTERRILGLHTDDRGGKRPHTSPIMSNRCLGNAHSSPSAAEWSSQQRPCTTSSPVRGIAQLLNGKLLPGKIQTISIDFLKPDKTSRCRSDVKFELDLRVLPATMPARAWQSVEPVVGSDLLNMTSQFDAPGPGNQPTGMPPGSPRSSSLPARSHHRRLSPNKQGKTVHSNLKARPFPRNPTPDHPGFAQRVVDSPVNESSAVNVAQTPAASKNNEQMSTTATVNSQDRVQPPYGIVEDRSGSPKQDIGTSFSTLMRSHDTLSAASQTLMRRTSELLQQPGNTDEVGSAGINGARPCQNVCLMPGLQRQEQELLTHDEKHLLSDMISVL